MSGRQPFAGEPHAVVVLPESDPTLGGELALLELERPGFEAELGTSVSFSATDPGEGARWLLLIDAEHEGAATVEHDPGARLIVSRASDVGGLFDSMNVLRTAARTAERVAAGAAGDVEDAILRVVDEVADTYPGFALRGLDWDEICTRHVDRVRAAEGATPAFQRWLAELQDGHTWVWKPAGNLPYAVHVESAATFVRVREETSGHDEGVRPGWTLVAIDDVAVDAPGWLARAAAPLHARPLIAGRRLLAGPVDEPRALTARAPSGALVTWSESPTGVPTGDLVTWTRLASGRAYVRVAAWIAGRGIEDRLDAALEELAGSDSLILDLRGNPGGNLVLATGTRDRFLRRVTNVGAIRYSIGGGELSEPFPLEAEPTADRRRWSGRLVVLTDSLTFSSAEDFLLGLQGLEHVTVVGQPSGGGSGRARALPLLPGTTLTVSTALTYDRFGRCVEGAGIPVDVLVAGSDEEVLAHAESV